MRLKLDEGFYFTNPGAALPDSIAVDVGDGRGFVEAAFGDTLEASYPQGDSAKIAVHCTYGAEALEARMTLAISDEPAPPRADDSWPLQAQGPDGKPGEHGWPGCSAPRAAGRSSTR